MGKSLAQIIADHAWPWGSGPAPALHCDECSHRIGKNASHLITESGHLLCSKCTFPDSGTRRLHGKFYPCCDVAWHDIFDHHTSQATRVGAWFALTKAGRLRELAERATMQR